MTTDNNTVTFTVAQVSEHNKHDDCFIIIKNKVYNVSKFLQDHPGGEEVITELAGQDATEEFEEIGHSQDAMILLQEFYVGELQGQVKADKKVVESRKVNNYPKAEEQVSLVWPIAIIAAGTLAYYLSQ